MFPFMFNPYFGRRTNFRLLDQVIPKVTTISVSDTDTATTLGICPKVWCQLPREGVMVFEARHTPAEASAELPVLISPTGSVSPAANTKNIPVVKADSSPLTGSEIAAGNRYFIYYNKCDNVMQIMNHYPKTYKDMTFSQLTSGTRIHVLEITGTFKKNTTYSLGTVVSVSKPYDEPMPPTQFPMPMQNRRKLVDLVISCDGEQRKLSVSEDKTMMTDSNIGLTIATEKSQIVNMVKQSLEDCRIKKESLSKIDEEMRRCEDILKILNVNSDITTNVTKDFKELDELRAEVKELKQLLQNISTVRPEENNIDPPTEEKENEI